MWWCQETLCTHTVFQTKWLSSLLSSHSPRCSLWEQSIKTTSLGIRIYVVWSTESSKLPWGVPNHWSLSTGTWPNNVDQRPTATDGQACNHDGNYVSRDCQKPFLYNSRTIVPVRNMGSCAIWHHTPCVCIAPPPASPVRQPLLHQDQQLFAGRKTGPGQSIGECETVKPNTSMCKRCEQECCFQRLSW